MNTLAQLQIFSEETLRHLLQAEIGTLALIILLFVVIVLFVNSRTVGKSLKIQEKQADNHSRLINQLSIMSGRIEKTNEIAEKHAVTASKQASALKDITEQNVKRTHVLVTLVNESRGLRQDVIKWNTAAELRASALQGSMGDVTSRLETLSSKIDGLSSAVQTHTATDGQVLEVLGDVKEVLETLKREVDDG